MTAQAVFLLHLLATLAMLGVIWIVQLVHYPLFAGVGAEGYPAYQAGHEARITWIVGPLMVLELGTAVALVAGPRLEGVPAWMPLVGLVLVGVIWASTAFVQVPLHRALSGGFDAEMHGRLVFSNWLRTAAWTLRAGLVLWMAALLMR